MYLTFKTGWKFVLVKEKKLKILQNEKSYTRFTRQYYFRTWIHSTDHNSLTEFRPTNKSNKILLNSPNSFIGAKYLIYFDLEFIIFVKKCSHEGQFCSDSWII